MKICLINVPNTKIMKTYYIVCSFICAAFIGGFIGLIIMANLKDDRCKLQSGTFERKTEFVPGGFLGIGAGNREYFICKEDGKRL